MIHHIRDHCRLYRLEDGRLVARARCYIVVASPGDWRGSLSVLEEVESLDQLWFAGEYEYGLELPDGRRGTIALTPMGFLDPVLRGKSYTFRGISLSPGQL